MEEEGLTIILSPIQLAAVLSGQPISEGETMSNRFWGGLKVVGGSLEMVGAGALLLAPEPTMATKVGGAALAIHGSDTVSTGVRQVWTGRGERTITEQGTTALARRLGADPKTAERIGVGVDIAVPVAISVGASAARIASIRTTGRISLVEHEAVTGSRIGGHTIAKHIGKSEAELRGRLAAQLGIPAASSFTSLEVAERVLYQALRSNRVAIEAWAKAAAPGAKRGFTFVAKDVIGHGVVRSTGQLIQMNKVTMVLKMQQYQGKLYYILTSFPTP